MQTFLSIRSHFQITILNYSAHNLSQLVYGLLRRINEVQRNSGSSMDRDQGGVGMMMYVGFPTFTFFWMFARHSSRAVVTAKHSHSPAVTEALLANN